jgi:DNA-binding PucR family transcriptional regulator
MQETPTAQAATTAIDEVSAAYVRVAAFLEPRVDEFAAALAEIYRQQIPHYADVPARTAHRNNRATLVLLVRRWRRGEALNDADAEAIAERARKWAMTDFPFMLIARTFQIGLRWVIAVVHEHAEELEIEARVLLAMQDRVWDWATLISEVLSDVEREHAVSVARRDATHRADFLRDLASGRVRAERLADEAAVYGLDVGQPYVAVRSDVVDGAAASALEAKIRQSGATSEHRVFQAVIDGRLLAVAPRSPKAPADVTLAVGSPMLLQDLHRSFAEAEEALATARAFGVTGLVELTALGPLPLATAAGNLAARLEREHFRELDELGRSGGEIEHTMLTLLDLDQNVDATAARLHLHRNTVRYRVTRFRNLTGLDVRRTDDLVTTWWLLKWRQARPARDAAAAAAAH